MHPETHHGCVWEGPGPSPLKKASPRRATSEGGSSPVEPHRGCIGRAVSQQFFVALSIRFLRLWDTSNRDPALAASSLADFEDILRTLFVKGHIMLDCAQEVAGLGVAKTITQIAMEQCQDMIKIRWGSRTKYLWSKTSKDECASVLAEIRSIVEDMLSRLAADFHTRDLYMSVEALELSAWQSVLAATQDAAK